MSGTCKTVFNLIISSIGIVLGLASFVTFFCCYGNMDAGVWGLVSGVLAAVCFQIHYLQYKEKLESWHSVETLSGLKLLGLMGFLAGLSGLSWYIFLACYKHIPVMPVESSAVISAVWAFMTAKWGLMLILNARMYINIFERDNPRLIRL